MHFSLLSNSLLPATLSGLVLTFIQSDPARFFSSCYPLFFSLLLWSPLLSSYFRVFSPLLCSPLCLLFCALLFSSTHTSLHVSSFLWSHLLASSWHIFCYLVFASLFFFDLLFIYCFFRLVCWTFFFSSIGRKENVPTYDELARGPRDSYVGRSSFLLLKEKKMFQHTTL